MPDDQVQLPPGYVLNQEVQLPRGYVNLAQPSTPTPPPTDTQKTAQGIAAAALPMAGSFLGPYGTVAGSLLGQAISPTPPKDLWDIGLNTGEDLLGQELIPRGISAAITHAPGIGASILRGNPTVAKSVYDTTREGLAQKIMKYKFPESAVVETGAQNAQDMARNMSPAQFSGNPLYDEKSIGSNLLNIPYFQQGASLEPINKVADKALSDVTQVRNWKLATGEPYSIEHLGLNKLLESSGPKGEEINADKILKELTGKNEDVYREALRPQTRQAFSDLMENLKTLDEGKPSTGSNIINYAKHRLVFALPFALGGHETSVAATAGIIIAGDALVSMIMKNPQAARLITQAAMTKGTAAASPILRKAILWAMRGMDAYMTIPGEKEPQKIHISDEGVPQLPQ